MKHIYILIQLLVGGIVLHAQSIPDTCMSSTIVRPDTILIRKLEEMAAEDQKWRTQMTMLRNNGGAQSALDSARTGVLRADSVHHQMLIDIIQEYCYPNTDIAGKDGSHYFWLMMQHQDQYPDFQKKVLRLMRAEVYRNKADRKDYAYLIDRVMINTGQKQVYGTQMRLNEAQTSFEPIPVMEPEKLNERRKEMGLGTIEAYIETMNQVKQGYLKKQ